jgi:hypothetical protein
MLRDVGCAQEIGNPVQGPLRRLNPPRLRSIFVQPQMRAPIMIIRKIAFQDAVQKTSVQHDEMVQTFTEVRKDNEDMKDLEIEGGHGQEIHRYHFPQVIAQEGCPCLPRGVAWLPHYVFADGSLGDRNPQLLEFPLNARSAPERVGSRNLPNRGPALYWRLEFLPTTGGRRASPAPPHLLRTAPLTADLGLAQPGNRNR